MIKDRDCVALYLLLDLQNMKVLGEFFNLRATDSINKTSLTNAVTADKTILFTSDKF